MGHGLLHKLNTYFPGGSDGKASVYNAGDLGLNPGSVRSPGEGNAIHSSSIAWKILWTEEPGRLQSMGLQRVRHDWATSPSLSLPLNWASPWWFRWWRICFHAGNLGSISESRRSAGEGNHYPLQYSCLENEHEQMSLAGCSPCGLKELDKTERLTFNTLNTLTHTHNLF